MELKFTKWEAGNQTKPESIKVTGGQDQAESILKALRHAVIKGQYIEAKLYHDGGGSLIKAYRIDNEGISDSNERKQTTKRSDEPLTKRQQTIAYLSKNYDSTIKKTKVIEDCLTYFHVFGELLSDMEKTKKDLGIPKQILEEQQCDYLLKTFINVWNLMDELGLKLDPEKSKKTAKSK